LISCNIFMDFLASNSIWNYRRVQIIIWVKLRPGTKLKRYTSFPSYHPSHLLSTAIATHPGPRQTLSWKMEPQCWRWRVLRPQNRHHYQRCPSSILPVCDYPARFPAAREVQLEIPIIRWGRPVQASHHSSGHPGESRKVYCDHYRALCRKMAFLAFSTSSRRNSCCCSLCA